MTTGMCYTNLEMWLKSTIVKKKHRHAKTEIKDYQEKHRHAKTEI